jgi:hypothetical protein
MKQIINRISRARMKQIRMSLVKVGSLRKAGKVILALAALLLLASIGILQAQGTALAQSGDGYDLSWWTVDGGGESSGGSYTLGGTAGQPDAGELAGGSYILGGGIWGGGELTVPPETRRIYLPLILRQYP